MKHFGNIAGVAEGQHFANRRELFAAGVHCPTQAGIPESSKEGADSILLYGAFLDDEDYGDMIIYTGRVACDLDPDSGHLVADQKMEGSNLALVVSQSQGLPVRVIRGASADSPYAPKQG